MRIAVFVIATLMSLSARAAGPEGWVLSLGWSPQLCSKNLGSKEVQCTEENYFRVHGLAPLFSGEAPACSDAPMPDELVDQLYLELPNRTQLRRIWSRQGACSGLDAKTYAEQLSRAARRFAIPPAYRSLGETLKTNAAAVQEAFAAANKELHSASLVLQCQRGFLSEVQVCVDADFRQQACPASVEPSCKERIEFRPLPKRRLREYKVDERL